MKIQNKTASEVKNSTRTRTLAHETRVKIGMLSAVAVIVLLLAGCHKEEVSDEFPFKPISLSELPEGIVPLEFKNKKEAMTFFNELKKNREENGFLIQEQYFGEMPEFEMPKTSRLKNNQEQLGGSEKLKPSGWWFQSLTVYLTYSSVGGEVDVSSSMTGFTFSVGWEQQSFTYSWSGNCVIYTVYGEEILYAYINAALFEIGRNSISATSIFCN